jgi:hypothetical protein
MAVLARGVPVAHAVRAFGVLRLAHLLEGESSPRSGASNAPFSLVTDWVIASAAEGAD